MALRCEPTASSIILHEDRLAADPARVVLRPFHLAWHAGGAERSRAHRLADDILSLTDAEAEAELAGVMRDFDKRHWQTERIFKERFEQLRPELGLNGVAISEVRQHLIGAYFCHEYSYAAAALMNPSVVAAPDQSGMQPGDVRFIMSMRAVGEGHISSVAFREGIVRSDGNFSLWPQQEVAMAVSIDDPAQAAHDGPVTVHRQADSTISNSVIFPITESQRNGLEDLRLVEFVHPDGKREWMGTYTAYSGLAIRSELLRTEDFRSFRLEPLNGAAARNKGMALFPECVDGRYRMIGRQDGKNLYLLSSDSLTDWDDEGVLLMEPRFPWEFVQMGNCGSPILCDEGWIVLTHGVGAMRKYSIGAALLDRKDPTKLLARTTCPILSAANEDREGYVPNVVYTCGMMRAGDMLFIPYAISDSAIRFASVAIPDILAFMQ
ncbi:MAG: glycoside hydrolase family 130 protein [Sphingobium sp.]